MSTWKWTAPVVVWMILPAVGGARELPIRGVVRDTVTSKQPLWQAGGRAAVGHVPSTRNLLGLERRHPLGLPTAESAERAKTVRVAVLRVQFPGEIPDDPRSTGNGRIDLRDTLTFFQEEGHEFERAPHNRQFFETIMRAMAQYYGVISNGRLTVTYDVFPRALDSAYTLDSSMCSYGLLPPNDGLAYFLIDAVLKADTDPDLVFSSYDAYVLFHAGSDQQHDFSPVTPTPCDFYTGYLRLLDPAFFIPVDGGTHFVEDGVVLPETATQDNRGTGLNGMVAHEFGHALGLVDIYSTRTGTTQVGDFSLMDNDAQQVGIEFAVDWSIDTFFDLLPVYPDAWSRAFLGFVNVREVLPDSMLLRYRADPDSVRPYFVTVAEGTDAFNQVLKIPITAKEYFLAEFRSPDQDVNTNPGVPGDQGVGIRFDSTFNAVLGPATCNPQTQAELDSCRVLGRDYDFQFFQPGDKGGMLIWQVDEQVAYDLVPTFEGDPFLHNNYEANALQWDRFRRFLEIEEADGLVDFGGNYFTYYGGQRELFVGGYNAEFGPATNPSTSSHTGARSHLRLFDISPVYPPNTSPDLLPLHHMKVKVQGDYLAAGWPRVIGAGSVAPLCVVHGNGGDTVLAVSDRYIVGWNDTGVALLTQLPGDRAQTQLRRFDDSVFTFTLAALARADTTLATPPSVGTDLVASERYISAVDVRGKVYIWRFADDNTDGWADTDTTFDLGAVPPQPPLWFDPDGDGTDGMFVASISGDALWWDGGTASTYDLLSATVRDWALAERAGERVVFVAGDTRLEQAVPMVPGNAIEVGLALESIVAVDDDRDGDDAIFGRAGRTLHRAVLTAGVPDPGAASAVPAWADVSLPLHGPLTSGDHDGDGLPSIYVGAGEWQAGFLPNFSLERNFPLRGNDVYTADPVCAAVTRNGRICFGGADGELQSYLPDGTFDPAGPFFVGDTVVSVAAIRSGGDSCVLLVRSTNGFVWGRRVEGEAQTPGAWTQFRSDAACVNRWNPAGSPQPVPRSASLAEETVYAYPNPAPRGPVTIRYYLAEAATVDVRIYDLAGNEVARGETAGSAGMDNEWVWDAGRIAPGVYFCRVKASLSGGDAVQTCKVAIIP